MSPKTDKLSPEARVLWLKIHNNVLAGRISDLYGTPEVGRNEFEEASTRLTYAVDALREISAKDTTLTADESLALVKTTDRFMKKVYAYREAFPMSYDKLQDGQTAQAQRCFREAIDTIQPIAEMGKKRLWPDAKGRTPEQIDNNRDMGSKGY
ncbi:MAG TPA: hypothetical protein VGZ00_10185 [Candidatus Baltobacteraceae bacterium]|jgi:hypothetical protein|nr:hypothetical protein [Candidatus Baltobacteraceae bacterium]